MRLHIWRICHNLWWELGNTRELLGISLVGVKPIIMSKEISANSKRENQQPQPQPQPQPLVFVPFEF
jgi:hypothetical protein